MSRLSLIGAVVILSIQLSCSVNIDQSPMITDSCVPQSIIESGGSSRYLWGLWLFRYDPVDQSLESIPSRSAEFHLNLVRMLEITLCQDCLKISNPQLIPPDQLSVDLTLKHPIESNLDLTGFDVRGVFISSGDFTFPYCERLVSYGGEYPLLLESDGYTALFNPTEFPESSGLPPVLKYTRGRYAVGQDPVATLNPFVAFGKENPRRMFLPGSEETISVVLKLPGGPFCFGYAVDASWVNPGIPVENPETDFPPEANCPEAYMLSARLTERLFDLPGSTASFEAIAWDHQGRDTIQNVLIEAPDIFENQIELDFLSLNPDGSAVFEGNLSNDLGAEQGIYPVLVQVRDSIADPNLGDMDAWLVRDIEVSHHEVNDEQPVAVAEFDPENPLVCESIIFDASGSYDPDGGEIISWQWDWDSNGVYDDEGEVTQHSWLETGDYSVQLMVTDDEGSKDELDAPLEFHVGQALPTAVASIPTTYSGEPVILDASGSYDNDCDGQSIKHCTWWLVDENGLPDELFNLPCEIVMEELDVWAQGDPAQLDIGGIGDGYVRLEVVDDEDSTDQLDEPAHFSIINDPDKNGWARTWGNCCLSPTFITYNMHNDIDVAIDPLGNICVGMTYYSANQYNDTDLDPGPALDFHPSVGYYEVRHAVIKMDPEGKFIWADTWGIGSDYDSLCAIATDSAGNILVTGSFRGTADFDPGSGVVERTALGWADVYIVMLNPDGDLVWIQTFGGEGLEAGSAVTTDDSDNVYIAGWFSYISDFDPGPGTDERTAVAITDAFVSKFNSDGVYQWARVWGGDENTHLSTFGDKATGVVAADDKVFIVGLFGGEADFDPGPGEDIHVDNGGYSDAFLTAFDDSGDFLWARTWGGFDGPYFGNQAKGIAYDGHGFLHVVGRFFGECDFDPGPETDTLVASNSDCFLATYNLAGDYERALVWGGSSIDFAEDIVADSTGDNYWITGGFSGTADLDPSANEHLETATATMFVYLIKIDSMGNLASAGTWGGNGGSPDYYNLALNLDINLTDDVFVTGFFAGECDFDPGPGEDSRYAINGNNVEHSHFLSKFPSDGAW